MNSCPKCQGKTGEGRCRRIPSNIFCYRLHNYLPISYLNINQYIILFSCRSMFHLQQGSWSILLHNTRIWSWTTYFRLLQPTERSHQWPALLQKRPLCNMVGRRSKLVHWKRQVQRPRQRLCLRQTRCVLCSYHYGLELEMADQKRRLEKSRKGFGIENSHMYLSTRYDVTIWAKRGFSPHAIGLVTK